MGFDEIKDKAKDLLGQHGDKVEEGIDKARDFADEKTGGKHSEQIGKVADQAKDRLGDAQR
jgi:MT0933-like antitoxin protein